MGVKNVQVIKRLYTFRLSWSSTPAFHCACVGLPRHRSGHAGAAGDHQLTHPRQHSTVHQDTPSSHAQTLQAAQI